MELEQERRQNFDQGSGCILLGEKERKQDNSSYLPGETELLKDDWWLFLIGQK